MFSSYTQRTSQNLFLRKVKQEVFDKAASSEGLGARTGPADISPKGKGMPKGKDKVAPAKPLSFEIASFPKLPQPKAAAKRTTTPDKTKKI